MAAYWYLEGIYRISDRTINWTADTVRAILLTSSYTFNEDHVFVSSLTANELTGYTRPSLANKAISKNTTDDKVYFTADDPTIASVATGQTISKVAIYKFVTNDSDSILIGYYDGFSLPTNGGGVTLDFNASGALAIRRIAP